MKALFINGSLRKKFNTAKMLEKTMEGAPSEGAKTELINLSFRLRVHRLP